jgi:hypothetical protein
MNSIHNFPPYYKMYSNIGFIWLRIGTCGGICEHCNEIWEIS